MQRQCDLYRRQTAAHPALTVGSLHEGLRAQALSEAHSMMCGEDSPLGGSREFRFLCEAIVSAENGRRLSVCKHLRFSQLFVRRSRLRHFAKTIYCSGRVVYLNARRRANAQLYAGGQP
jgi:hypothetical protein